MKQKLLRSNSKPPRIPPATGKCRSRRILVVDDNLFDCHRNAEVLIRQGYEVTTSEYCETGWEELQATPYSLLIVKREMPTMTGTELVMLLRSARISLPVILIAGQLPKTPPPLQLGLHPMVTLLQPATPEEVLAAVKVVLAATRAPGRAPMPADPSRPRAAWDLRL